MYASTRRTSTSALSRLSILSHPDDIEKNLRSSDPQCSLNDVMSHCTSLLGNSDLTPRASPVLGWDRSAHSSDTEYEERKTAKSPSALTVACVLDVCLKKESELDANEGGSVRSTKTLCSKEESTDVGSTPPPVPTRRRLLEGKEMKSESESVSKVSDSCGRSPHMEKCFIESYPRTVRHRSSQNYDVLGESDETWMDSIARLTKSVYGDIIGNEKCSPPDRHSISVISTTTLDGEKGEETLSRWRKWADRRTKNPQLTSESSEKSVNRIVASLIRAAEESRYLSNDRPDTLPLPPTSTSPAQDVGTQTSPFSISRSSSFDWINEPTENALKNIKTPVGTPRTSLPVSHQPTSPSLVHFPPPLCSSPSSSTECDIEVTEMTKGRNGLQLALDESLTLLLQCTNDGSNTRTHPPHPPKPKPRTKLSLNYSGEKSFHSPPIASHRRLLGTNVNSDSLPTDLRKVPTHPTSPTDGGPAQAVMSDSVYDNVPPKRKSRKSSEEPFLSSIISRHSPPKEAESALSAVKEPNESLGSKFHNGFPIRINDRAGSCELLSTDTPDPDSLLLQTKLKRADEDADRCCDWLRNAGFPQYAKQYEDGQFPLDLKSVNLDHTFLDADSLAALYRRLSTLNRTAIMRIDQVVLRRRNENHCDSREVYDQDEEVALSGRWQYQRNSHTWSRIGNESMYDAQRNTVSTRPQWDFSHRELDRSHLNTMEKASTSSCESQRIHRSLQRSHSERIKERARAIMKKMDIRSSSRRRKPQNEPMLIGDPVLVSYDTASSDSRKMLPKEIQYQVASRGRNKNSKRQGMLLLSPSSPDSSTTSDDSFTQRRDRSVPPRMGQPEVRYKPPYPAYNRYSRREYREREIQDRQGNPYDTYLYPHHPIRALRSSSRPPQLFRADLQSTAYSDAFFSSLDSSPSNSDLSSFSQKFLSSPPTSKGLMISRQPNIHPDGYFVHEMSPDTSMRRSLQKHSPPLWRDNKRIEDSRDVERDLMASSIRGNERENDGDLNDHLRIVTGVGNKLSCSSLDVTGSEEHLSSHTLTFQRRDSGVGSSLSRSPSGPSAHRLRASVMPYSSLSTTAALRNPVLSASSGHPMTSSLASTGSGNSTREEDSSTFFTDIQLARCVDALGVVELSRIRKLAYLRVTALFEREERKSGIRMGSIPSNGGQAVKNWAMQKLFNKIKHMDARSGKDENCVFGQSLETIHRRSGCSLPRSMLEVLKFLRQMAPETVGIFRKNGVRSRIAELRRLADTLSDRDIFIGENRLESGQVHDVADMLKQYLRELPEPLMTEKLSETFANIYQYLPENERLVAVQYALLLLPDENREALQTLLFFLHDVARHSDSNNMTSQNLSVCFTPSLFHLSASRLNNISSTRRHKTIGAAGMPTEKEMKETRAAQSCLTSLIDECRTLFIVPDSLPCERSEIQNDHPMLNQIGGVGYRSYLVRKIKDLVKEHADRWRSWSSEGSVDGVEISSKKALDNHPLKTFRVTVDVEAPPREILQRILRERPLWDPSTVNWRRVDNLQSDTDLFQYVINDTPGHPTRDFHVVRMYRSDLPDIRGSCCVIERSVHCEEAQLLGGVPAAVLDYRILIEPNSGRSRVTYISRIDFRGRGLLWYNRVYGSLLARQMSRLRESFQQTTDQGPETKV